MAQRQDTLFLALTRPAMVWGVTYSFVVLNLVATGMVFVWTGSFWTILLGGPVHLVGYLACLREPRRFDLWWVKLRHALPTPTRFYWGANSYRP